MQSFSIVPYLSPKIQIHQHDGKAPEYKQLKDFKAQILAMKKKEDEENFDEAVANVFKAYHKTTVRECR
jgi:hypothetical protein